MVLRTLFRRSATLLTVIVAVPGMSLALASEDMQSHLSPLEQLGKLLFEDTNLSQPAGQACASCHVQGHAFTGNGGSSVPAIAVGSRGNTGGQFGQRNTPTTMYTLYNPPFSFVAEQGKAGATEYTPTGGLFWDGRADSLMDQARGPLLNPLEMANTDEAAVVEKVRAATYAADFESVFGSGALAETKTGMDNIVTALAGYENSTAFHPFSSKFDQVLEGKAQFSADEAEGFALFKAEDKGNCIACHVGDTGSHDPADWLFTDFTYDNLGLPRNAAIPSSREAGHYDLGLCQRDGLAAQLPEGVSLQGLCGAFKVPTLRNVAVTAPYFHNGVIATLTEAVRFYVTRETNPDRWFPKGTDGPLKYNDLAAEDRPNVNTGEVPYDRKFGEPPRLTDVEIEQLVAFLKTLTDEGMSEQ